MYDVDGNGWIDLREMTRIVKSIYKMMGPNQVRHVRLQTLRFIDLWLYYRPLLTSSRPLRKGPRTFSREWMSTATGGWPGRSLSGPASMTTTLLNSSVPSEYWESYIILWILNRCRKSISRFTSRKIFSKYLKTYLFQAIDRWYSLAHSLS